MDVFYYYTYGTAAWLGLQAAPLIVSPHMITPLLSPEMRQATVLEDYFCRSLGFALVTLGVLTIILTGSVPLTSTFSDATPHPASSTGGVTTDPADPKAPYAVPVLTLTTAFHALSAFFSYTQYVHTASVPFAVGTVGYAILAAVGGWCILFASSSGRISRKTGADKRTSGWPFGNAEADRKRAGKKGL